MSMERILSMKKMSVGIGFIAFILCYAILACQSELSPLQIGGLATVAFGVGAMDFPAVWEALKKKKTWVNIVYVAAKIVFLASTGLLAMICFMFYLASI